MIDEEAQAWFDCKECMALMDDPHLVGACASVGIEFGKSTTQMVREFLRSNHERHACEWDPVECDCRYPEPDGLGECTQCRRRVMPDRR